MFEKVEVLGFLKGKNMGKVNYNNKIYTSLESIILDFTYSEFIYFIYNFGMDYYDRINTLTREEWENIYNCLKENYNKYEVLKEINFKQFKINISSFIESIIKKKNNKTQYREEALDCFGCGNKKAKLKYLIRDFEEMEKMDKVFIEEDKNK